MENDGNEGQAGAFLSIKAKWWGSQVGICESIEGLEANGLEIILRTVIWFVGFKQLKFTSELELWMKLTLIPVIVSIKLYYNLAVLNI